MRRLAVLAFALLPLSSWADSGYSTDVVGYRCDVAGGHLSIAYRIIDGNVSTPVEDGWKLWNLGRLISMKDDDHIGKLRTVGARCALGKTIYTMQLGPAPQNMNIQGHCGAADILAWVILRRNGRVILPNTTLGPRCEEDGPVVTGLDVDVTAAEPRITTVSSDEIYP